MLIVEKKRLILFEVIGAIFVSIGAYVFHFLYEWSGNNFVVGLFTATDESIFAHTKILFFPFLIYSIAEYFVVKVDFRQFVYAKAMMAVLLFVLVIVGYYTYSGIIGQNIMIVDILSAFFYTFLAFFISYRFIVGKKISQKAYIIALMLLAVVFFAEIFFTISPLNISLFIPME